MSFAQAAAVLLQQRKGNEILQANTEKTASNGPQSTKDISEHRGATSVLLPTPLPTQQQLPQPPLPRLASKHAADAAPAAAAAGSSDAKYVYVQSNGRRVLLQVDDEENGSTSGESDYEAAVYEAAVVAEELERVRLGNSSNAGGGKGIQELGPVQWDFPPIKLTELPAAVVEPVPSKAACHSSIRDGEPLVTPPSALNTLNKTACPLAAAEQETLQGMSVELLRQHLRGRGVPDSELLRCIEKRELVAMAMALAAPAKQAAGEFATPRPPARVDAARTDAARTDSLDELNGQQAAEIQRLRARVEKQARLLEDRLEVEAGMRKQEKQQHENIRALQASVAALQQEKAQLAQSVAHTAAERDLARSEHVRDSQCMHAMLADAGQYIEHLRGEVLVLQLNLQHSLAETMSFAQAAAYAHAAAEDFKVRAADKNRDSDSEKGFAMENIKKSIETAVEEIKGLAEEERKKQIKALRLRWHPDKNPVLTEFATEVSKIINTAVKSMEVEVEKKEKKETETPTNPANCTPSQKKQATETC